MPIDSILQRVAGIVVFMGLVTEAGVGCAPRDPSVASEPVVVDGGPAVAEASSRVAEAATRSLAGADAAVRGRVNAAIAAVNAVNARVVSLFERLREGASGTDGDELDATLAALAEVPAGSAPVEAYRAATTAFIAEARGQLATEVDVQQVRDAYNVWAARAQALAAAYEANPVALW